MHILQSFRIAVFLSFFRHNKTPKVFCLTFGVHVIGAAPLTFKTAYYSHSIVAGGLDEMS